MLRKSVVLVAALVLVCPLIHAQGGCVNSPENPTALLALVGAAGAVVARLRSRR
jgi:XrtJ-associated TM-motif-TM protein